MFQALDSQKMTLLMIAGAVFAAVGLWLLLRPKPAHGAAKIELFGLKFESSSAGVLVFLIGAAFVSLPLFVEIKPMAATVEGSVGESVPRENGGDSSNIALVLPSDASVEESEPNDSVQDANQISLGQTMAGEVRSDEADWVVVAIPEAGPRDIRVKLRKLSGGTLWGNLYDADEERQTFIHVPTGAGTAVIDRGDRDRIYVNIYSGGGTLRYELIAEGAE